MAPHVTFDEQGYRRVSAEPFANEWSILQRNQATREMQNASLIVLKSSNIEYLVPRAFRWIFLGIVAASVWAFVQNRSTILANVLVFSPIPTPKP